jgi:hypothetical protein
LNMSAWQDFKCLCTLELRVKVCLPWQSLLAKIIVI